MKRTASAVLLTLGGLVIFVLGNPYYRIFPTNWNLAFYIAMAAAFLVGWGVLKHIGVPRDWCMAVYALFTASVALVFLRLGPLNLPSDPTNLVRDLALDKLSQFLHIVPVLVGLTLLAGGDLPSIYIRRGALKPGLTFGLISFVVFAVVGIVIQAGSAGAFIPKLLPALPWVLLFVFANATMEELWFRAIFLRPYEALIGRWGAILVTSVIFGAAHINATYEFPGGGIIFGLVVAGLGVAGAHAMMKDDSLIGPVLFHAGYDLMILVPVLASM